MIIEVRVVPRSSKRELAVTGERKYKAWLKSVPVNGKANMELVELLAKEFDCHKKDIIFKRGETSKVKTIEVIGIEQSLF